MWCLFAVPINEMSARQKRFAQFAVDGLCVPRAHTHTNANKHFSSSNVNVSLVCVWRLNECPCACLRGFQVWAEFIFILFFSSDKISNVRFIKIEHTFPLTHIRENSRSFRISYEIQELKSDFYLRVNVQWKQSTQNMLDSKKRTAKYPKIESFRLHNRVVCEADVHI